MDINGRMKVKTLKSQFKDEFGLTLRVYDGRSFADDDATLASIRKGDSRGGEFTPRKNTKVGNLEDKIQEMFGIKTQIAGSDDSYLCDNDMTLQAALDEDGKKIERKQRKKGGHEAKSVKDGGVSSETEKDIDDPFSLDDDEDLEDSYDFERKAKELIEAGSKETARKYIEKGIAVAEDADDLARLATVVCSSDEDEGLGDKDWGREIFEQAEKKLDDIWDIMNFADKVSQEDILNDKKWAVSLYKQAEGSEGADSGDFRMIADEVARLGEKDLAKSLYEKAFNAAEDSTGLIRLAESLKDDFGDRTWADVVVEEAVMKAEGVSDLLGCAQTLASQFDDKVKARNIYVKALENAEDCQYQEIFQSIEAYDYLGDLDWARTLADEHGFILESDRLIISSMFETLEGRTRCRYYCAYFIRPDDTFVGYIAGSSGGGSFSSEECYGETVDGEFESLFVNNIDVFEGSSDAYEDSYYGIQDIFHSILDEDAYEDDFSMYLDETKIQEIAEKNQIRITKNEDMTFLNKGDADNKIVRKLCESIGLTSAPSVD